MKTSSAVPAHCLATQEQIQYELDRRRPGQSKITTPRKARHWGVQQQLMAGMGGRRRLPLLAAAA